MLHSLFDRCTWNFFLPPSRVDTVCHSPAMMSTLTHFKERTFTDPTVTVVLQDVVSVNSTTCPLCLCFGVLSCHGLQVVRELREVHGHHILYAFIWEPNMAQGAGPTKHCFSKKSDLGSMRSKSEIYTDYISMDHTYCRRYDYSL